jgi:hypothetical protein
MVDKKVHQRGDGKERILVVN